jgi:iron complex outermembrane recepter protein
MTKQRVAARNILVGVLTCLLLSVTASISAQNDAPRYEFDIEQLPIVHALNRFHLQTRLQVGYLPASSEEEQTLVGPIRGRYTAEEALTLLLTPVGFSFQWSGSNAVDIVSPEDPRNSTGTERRHPHASNIKAIAAQIERVIVTAGRIRDVDELASPVRVIDRKSIARSGAATIADLLKYISQQPYTYSEGFRASGAQFAELRGLGPDMTLVLINGRRTLPTASNITSNAFDLNTIPITAVDRVEILLDSASAPYGTDAIGGLINIVLRRDISDPAIDLHYGTAKSGADQRRASFSAGHLWHRANGALVVDYFDLNTLLGAERNRWRDQDFRRFGGTDQRSINSSPGNITSLLAADLPGLPTRFAAVPSGSQGASVTTADFLATAGQRNLESLFQYWALVPEGRRFSALGLGEFQLAPHLLASGEILYVDRRAGFQFAPPFLPGVPVPATNAFNPFKVPVVANVLLTGIEPQKQNVESTLMRAVAGLHGERNTWSWDIALLRTDEEATTWIDRTLDFTRVIAALAQSDASQALNVFQDGPGGSPQLLASLLAARKTDRLASKGTQVTGFASGVLPLKAPAGLITLVVGGEWREEVAEFDASLGTFERSIAAGFAQFKVPLINKAMQLRMVDEMSLTVSGRQDDYSDFGVIFNPQFGLIWRLNRDWTVRSSYGRSFRPPSLYELYLPKISVPTQFTDPRRNGELASFAVIAGGNRELAPTRGKSFTAGLTFAPQVLGALDISANYWRVAMEDRIAFPAVAVMLANEAAFTDRIVRADPTPADIEAGLPGVLRTVDMSRANAGRLETSGIDVSATYDFDTSLGHFTPSLSATWIDHFETMDLSSTPAVERVNIASVQGTIPKWRVVPRLEWQRGIAEASINARYTPAYDDAITGVQTGRRIPSQTIIDIQASIYLNKRGTGESPRRGFKITAGALNLSDEHAPFSEVRSAAGFDMSQGDLKGRFVYLRLGKTF